MTRYTLIEFMPTHLRAQHVAARNHGTYPANGAERVYVACDVSASDLHPTWADVLEDEIRECDVPATATRSDEIPDEALAPAPPSESPEWDDRCMGG